MNNLENVEILSNEIKEVIGIIVNKCPDVVFGGSIALNAVGLINRKVSDIDIFVRDNKSLTNGNLLDAGIIDDESLLSDTVTNTNGKEIQRTGAKINGIKICIFKVDTEELQHSICEFSGLKIKIQNINYAIQAKLSYKFKNEKHKDDLDEIFKEIDKMLEKKDLDKILLKGAFVDDRKDEEVLNDEKLNNDEYLFKENNKYIMKTWNYNPPYEIVFGTQDDWNQTLVTAFNSVIEENNILNFPIEIYSPEKFRKIFESLYYYNPKDNTLSNKYIVKYGSSNFQNIILINSQYELEILNYVEENNVETKSDILLGIEYLIKERDDVIDSFINIIKNKLYSKEYCLQELDIILEFNKKIKILEDTLIFLRIKNKNN